MPFTFRRERWNGIDAVALSNDTTLALFAIRGGTLLRWRTSRRGPAVDLVDGYRDIAELDAQDGVRNGVMAPFQNRIAGGRYEYGGDWHDLLPGSEDRLVYHGFLRVIDLDVQSAAIESHSARIPFGTKQIR